MPSNNNNNNNNNNTPRNNTPRTPINTIPNNSPRTPRNNTPRTPIPNTRNTPRTPRTHYNNNALSTPNQSTKRLPPKTVKRHVKNHNKLNTKKAKRRDKFSEEEAKRNAQIAKTFEKLDAIIDALGFTEESDYYIVGSMAVFLYTIKDSPDLLPKLPIPDDVDLVKFNVEQTEAFIPEGFDLVNSAEKPIKSTTPIQFKDGQTLKLLSNPEYKVDFILQEKLRQSYSRIKKQQTKSTITPTIIDNVNIKYPNRKYKVSKFEHLKSDYGNPRTNRTNKKNNNAIKLSVLEQLNSEITQSTNSTNSTNSNGNNNGNGNGNTRKNLFSLYNGNSN